ncbi:hypothetical protein ATCC90586_003742 [Pythium insidiosum]|nr:hypothetical protein ATCC90586_003742 [Pythium insidiosum]
MGIRVAMAVCLAAGSWLLGQAAAATPKPTPASTSEADTCTSGCRSITCISSWWRDSHTPALVGAAVLIFFATFLPRVLVRLVIFVLTKIPFIAQTASDFREHCTSSSSYLISATLVFVALMLSDLDAFFCQLDNYIWGVFFLIWLYSLFNVVESLAIRRFVGPNGDFSKRVVISESVKIMRLTTMLIIALIIYSSAVGQQELLKYSILAVIGLAIALGFVPSFHNVVGGLFLAFNTQFKIDDFINVGDAQGFVHRVSLRYTTIVTMDGTTVFVPNSFFLYKPMVNFSQRPKRDIDIRFRVSPATPVGTLRQCLLRLEAMLHSLHMGLTSHEENQSDLRHGEKWERFCYVAMEDLFEIHVFSYTDELDERKYSMIRSEVWLAIMEIIEELNIEIDLNPEPDDANDGELESIETGSLIQNPATAGNGVLNGVQISTS